jgi:hypothetical protein
MIKIKTIFKLGVIIFGLVRFLSKKVTKPNFFFKNRNWVKPTGFGSIFLGKKRFKPVWLGFFSGFGSVRFFWFFAYKTETEPNRPVFSKF